MIFHQGSNLFLVVLLLAFHSGYSTTPNNENNNSPTSDIISFPSGSSSSSSSDPRVIKVILPGQQQQQQGPQQVPPPPNMINPFYKMEPVIFSAVRASEQSRKAISRIQFDNTLTDIGFGWNSGRNEFKCYYPGVYFFTFAALSTPASQFKVSLMKNGNEIVSTWGQQTGYHAGSNSAILQLDKNDRVYLNIQEGLIHESSSRNKGYTTFSGFRIN